MKRPAVAALIATGLALGLVSAVTGATAGSAVISTVAGTGASATGPGADGTLALETPIDHPRGIAIRPGGGFYVAEPFRATVRRVDASGVVTRVAGTGVRGFSGDGGAAVSSQLDGVHGVALAAGGSFALADTGNHRIRLVAADGTITTIAGTGVAGYGGDGGPATAARLEAPRGIAALSAGGFLVPDTGNDRIRRISADGTITTVAGSGVRGFGGDGGPATAAQLNLPFYAAPLAGGGMLIADTANHRIRRVSAEGRITTVAGTGTPGFGGDGGPAVAAALSSPHAVVPLPDGGFLVADTGNDRVRRVHPDGTITTVAGVGAPGYGGDGGPATLAALDAPKALAVLADRSGYLIADADNNRLRLVTTNLAPALVVRIPGTVRTKRGRATSLPVTLSDRARVRLDVMHKAKRVLRLTAVRPSGSSRMLFGKALPRGTYELRVLATATDGRDAQTTGRLVVHA